MQDWNEIPVDVFDDPDDPMPPARPVVPPTRLPFDLYLDDPETGERLWIYAAGTALESFRERGVVLAPAGDRPAVTALTVSARHPDRPNPEPFAVFRFPQDVRGRRLTFRFSRPFPAGKLQVEAEGVAEGQPAS